jgi:hypothetical protein
MLSSVVDMKVNNINDYAINAQSKSFFIGEMWMVKNFDFMSIGSLFKYKY